MSTLDILDKLFPDHPKPSRSSEWEVLKQRLAVGQTVTGTVVATSPFGAWIDLGVEFPALLEILVMERLTPDRYRADDWCPVGSEVTGFVSGIREDAHQVALWQVRLGHWRTQQPQQ